MTGPKLAALLGRLVTPAGRRQLTPLATGATNDVALRYDHITDWKALGQLLAGTGVVLYDGQEWFILEVV